MTVQEVIGKAVAGGYHIYGSDGMDTEYEGATNDYSAWTRKDNDSSFLVPTEETFLDLHFWQALGRALGWSEGCDLALLCVHGEEEGQWYRGYYWMFQWLRFIQALADGHTPEAFFAHLPSSQRIASETTNRHQAGRNHSPDIDCQSMHDIPHEWEFAQQVRTRAESSRQTAQALREECQQTRHRRAILRQGLHSEGGDGHRSPEGRPNKLQYPMVQHGERDASRVGGV
jgi:hypothetical protein